MPRSRSNKETLQPKQVSDPTPGYEDLVEKAERSDPELANRERWEREAQRQYEEQKRKKRIVK